MYKRITCFINAKNYNFCIFSLLVCQDLNPVSNYQFCIIRQYMEIIYDDSSWTI